MVNFFRLLFMKGQEWRIVTEPSLFPSAFSPSLWGMQPEAYASFWQAWRAARRFVAAHPYGIAEIVHRPLPHPNGSW